MTYRPDIDGLRAAAVLSVILYHLRVPGFGGGFVGVDVFFVISGYLVCRQISVEIDARDFLFSRFYERRIRRIFPALFVVIVACIPVAVWLFIADDLLRVGRSIVATSFFSSNILFWIESGYFEAASQTKLLLHTWSLAVEEQFYIAFPLLLIASLRFFKDSRKPELVILSSRWETVIHQDTPGARDFQCHFTVARRRNIRASGPRYTHLSQFGWHD